jgi:2-isopropylmalate synthase
VSSEQIWTSFQDEYLPASADMVEQKWGRYELLATRATSANDGEVSLEARLRVDDAEVDTTHVGNGPIDAFLGMLSAQGQGIEVKLYDYVEHTMSAGSNAQAAAYVELDIHGQRLWGVGIDGDISRASLKAIVSAVNRWVRAANVVSDAELIAH